jgi:hypothetical protein
VPGIIFCKTSRIIKTFTDGWYESTPYASFSSFREALGMPAILSALHSHSERVKKKGREKKICDLFCCSQEINIETERPILSSPAHAPKRQGRRHKSPKLKV